VHDLRGNLTSDGTYDYGYDAANHLTRVANAGSSVDNATLTYDPEGRLYQNVAHSTTTRFLYDGANLIGEYSSGGALVPLFGHPRPTGSRVSV
jgi:YD repeat-containing protein